MLDERSDHGGLWQVDRLHLDRVGRDTLYGLLASQRGRLFRDADFADLLQEARALQQSAEYDQYRRRRVVTEH